MTISRASGTTNPETIDLAEQQRLWRRRLDDLKMRESELWADIRKNWNSQEEARDKLRAVNDEIERVVR
jgi:hypothetical protein